MVRKIKACLCNKRGASLIWAVFILLASVIFLVGVFQISSTYSIAAEGKNEIKAAGEAAIQNSYLDTTEGVGTASLSVDDIKGHLESDSGLQAVGSDEKKLDANNNEVFSIQNLSVSAVQNRGSKSSVQNGYAISGTISRPINFGGTHVLDVPVSVTVYVWYAPKAF